MTLIKKLFFFAAVVVIMAETLTSCINRGNILNNMELSENTNIFETVTTVYSESQLRDLSTLNCSIDELNSRFPVECIKKTDNHYRVSYVGENMFTVILFDENGKWIMANTYKAYLPLSDYKTIRKGQSLDEVMEKDPNGEYLFLFTGRDDSPRISCHYSVDGYLITIKYISNVVDEIQIELL